MCAKWIKNKEWSSRYWQDIKDFESKLLGQRHKGGQSNCNANPIDPRVASNWLVAWLRRPESIIFAWSSLLHSSYFHPFSIWSSNFEPFILERKKNEFERFIHRLGLKQAVGQGNWNNICFNSCVQLLLHKRCVHIWPEWAKTFPGLWLVNWSSTSVIVRPPTVLFQYYSEPKCNVTLNFIGGSEGIMIRRFSKIYVFS